MSERTLTHRQLARMLGVSETTIKSYRRKFPGCIPIANKGKPIRFTEEAGQVCMRIRELFGRGMAVPEVRARLAEEFSFIPPEDQSEENSSSVAAEQTQPHEGTTVQAVEPARTSLPDEYTTAMSNLAKSMVKLTMQQEKVLKKMDAIDARLAQLGLAPVAENGERTVALPDELVQWLGNAQAAMARMEHIVTGMQASANTDNTSGKGFGSQSDDFTHGRSLSSSRHSAPESAEKTHHRKIVRIKSATGDISEYSLEQDSREETMQHGEAGYDPAQPHASGQDTASSHEDSAYDGGAADTASSAQPYMQDTPSQFAAYTQPPQDPPRELLTLPLVALNPEGEYIGVAGRSRGRFNINDLKAMLANTFSGEERYVVSWQYTANGWLLVLEQPNNPEPKNISLLVEMRTTPRGNTVTLIEHLTLNSQDEDPMLLYNFIKAIYEA